MLHGYTLPKESPKITRHTPGVLLTSAFFHLKSVNFAISRNTDIDCILQIISSSFNLFWVFKVFFNKLVAILMMSAKMATLVLLKIKLFWNKGYDVIIYVHDVTNQILSCDSNCIVDVVMWPKFGNTKIYMREVIVTSIF